MSKTILRLKSGMDKLQPSTNAVSVSNLFRLGTLLANAQYISLAKATITAFEAEILQHPWMYASLLTGVVAARLGVKEVKVAPGDEEALRRYYALPRAEARVLVLEKQAKPEAVAPLEIKEVSAADGVQDSKTKEETQTQADTAVPVPDVPVAETPLAAQPGTTTEHKETSESVEQPSTEKPTEPTTVG